MIEHITGYNQHTWQKTIHNIWNSAQTNLVEEAKQAGVQLNLLGDGPCDSPGHNAKYLLCTMINAISGKILISKLVQVRLKSRNYNIVIW